MIAEAELAHWRQVVPWLDAAQVEQDLVLSRMIVEIARHPLLGHELVFRGGTCLHKLWLDRPWRYSEDLDYVRRSASGIGEILDALRDIAAVVGFDDVVTDIGVHPKASLRSTLITGGRLRVKIEMNTFERSPARPLTIRAFAVASPWFGGAADVPTFQLEELTATKIRALFQRRKGRDLFDLWLAVEQGDASIDGIAECFAPYRPTGWTGIERCRTSRPSSSTGTSSTTSTRWSTRGPTATPSKAPANSQLRSSGGPDENGAACLEQRRTGWFGALQRAKDMRSKTAR